MSAAVRGSTPVIQQLRLDDTEAVADELFAEACKAAGVLNHIDECMVVQASGELLQLLTWQSRARLEQGGSGVHREFAANPS